MSLDFASQRETLERRGGQRLARKTRGLPLARRFDIAFLVLFGASGLLLLTFWSVSVAAGWRLGLFDPPLVRPLPDERVLTNLRDDLDQRPLLAATLHQDYLYVSQQGGDLHRYNPRTELWTRERAGKLLGFKDLVDLRSDGRGLWARSAHGALARFQDGEWTSIFGESAFEDLGGTPPSTEDLTSAALSTDGRWLLLGARQHGVGLFDRQRRRWVTLPTEALTALPSPSVSHVRWWKDRFWIGGPQGLSYLIPREDGSPEKDGPNLVARGDLDGVITDLDAGDALWVLETRPCVNDSPRSPAKDCMRLSRFTSPENPPEALIDEERRYPELDLSGLTVAQQQGDVLVVAGGSGLFSYDLRRHTWTRHLGQPILAHWRDPQRGLYVGSRAGAAHFVGGRLRRQWSFETPATSQERLLRIVPGSGDEVLTFTNQGHIRALLPDGQIQTVLAASRTRLDPRSYSEALVLEDGQVLFRSPAGVMVHDVLRRTYEDHPRDRLPDWLFDAQTRFEVAGHRIYGLQPSIGGRQSVLVTDTSRMARKEFNEPGRVPAPIEATTSWGDDGLAMIAGDGGVYVAGQQTLHPLTGEAAGDLSEANWNDIALDNEKLAVATDQGLRLYWRNRRGWQEWILPGTPLRELAVAGGELRMLTADGRLARPNAEDPFLIGGEDRDWRVTQADLTDARQVDGQIYLAGNGWIQRYGPQRRRLNNRWFVGTAGAAGDIRLVDVIGTGDLAQPLSWVGQRAFLGSIELDPGAGRVVGMSSGRRSIWTVRQRGVGQPRYLKGYARDQPLDPGARRCLFRHPSATYGLPVDVRQIRPGLLAVATAGGLQLYSRSARSWYRVHWRGSPLLGEIHMLGDHLALWAGGRLRLVDLSHVELPPSCSGQNTVDVKVVWSVEAKAAVFDEPVFDKKSTPGKKRRPSVVWIDDTGAVRQWSDGETSTLLKRPTGAPATSSLRRVYRFDQRLVFTGEPASGEMALYVYDLADHTWRTYPVAPPSGQDGAVTGLNLEGSAAPWTLTITTDQGAIHTGSFDPDDARGRSIQVREVLASRRRRPGSLGADPKAVLDVQWRLGNWAFVLPGGLAIFDPVDRRWLDPIPFPGPPDPTLSLRQAVGIDVLVKAAGREWWIEQDRLLNSESPRFVRFEPGDDLATVIDESARVWRLRPDGRVERCGASQGAVYVCEVEIPADAGDPVVALEEGPGGIGLLARRRSGLGKSSQSVPQGALIVLTGRRAELELSLPPAMDTGWLAWIRAAAGSGVGSFRLATASGPRTFSLEQFFRNGRLLFEDVRAVLAEGSSSLHAATPDGVWTHQGGSLSLERRSPVLFTSVRLDGDVRAAHGRFLTATASYHLTEARLESGGYSEHRVQLGNQVTLVERTAQPAVSATIQARGGTIPAFTKAGFAWDQRRGLALHPTHGPILLTRAGLHPLELGTGDATFNLGPTGQAHRTGTLLSGPGGQPLFNTGDTDTYRLGGQALDAGWQLSPDVLDQTLVETRYWRWSRQGGNLRVRSNIAADRLRLRSDRSGWHLTSDRLRAAAFHDGDLRVLTDAAFENLGETLKPNTERHAAFEADLLTSLALKPGEPPGLYARQATPGKATWSRWDPKTTSLESLATEQDPLRDRDLVLHGRLRLKMRAGRVMGDLRVDDPGTEASYWKPFRLTSRGFPFDRVTALGGVGDRMLLASPAGLQVYRAGRGLDLDDPEAIYALPNPVTRLGRPLADPSRFHVITEKDCFEWKNDALEKCEQRESLKQRWRGEDDLWRFTSRSTAQGQRVRGVYKNVQGKNAQGIVTKTEVRLRGGRLPHDQLLDLSACGKITATLWSNGWFSLHANRALSLDASQNINDLAGQRPRRLVCVRQDREIDPAKSKAGRRLTKGLYVVGQDRDWRWDGTFVAITEAGVRDALRQRPLQQIGRLRLIRRSGSGFVYQLRDADWKWTDLPWNSTRGRVSIDVIHDLQSDGDTLWASTAAGLVPFGRQDRSPQDSSLQDRALHLDPESLVVIPKPRIEGRPCSISDFELREGMALVRCNSDSKKVFERSLATRGGLATGGQDGFRPHRALPGQSGDPFAEHDFITEESSGSWSWRLVDRRGGRPGTLEARLHGEPLGLIRGRFDFDHLTSVALASPGRIELTSSVGGWYQHPVSSLHARDVGRPKTIGAVRPEDVVRVTLSRADPDQTGVADASAQAPKLCATTQDDSAVLLADGVVVGSARECAEDQGQGGLWSYDRLGEGLRMRGPGVAGGWAPRTLRQGRFSDQIALGPTVTSTGIEGDGGYYLVPTEAGVLRLDPDGVARAIYAPEHQDLAPGEVPAVLHFGPDGRAVYVTPTSVRDLESGEQVSDASFYVPDGARATALTAWTEGPGNLLRLAWTRQEPDLTQQPGWTLLRATDYAAVDQNMLPLDASEWGRFQRGRIGWDDPSAVFGLRLTAPNSGSRSLELFSQQDGRAFQIPWRQPLLPLELLPRGSSLFVIQPDEISEVRLDVGVEELFQ